MIRETKTRVSDIIKVCMMGFAERAWEARGPGRDRDEGMNNDDKFCTEKRRKYNKTRAGRLRKCPSRLHPLTDTYFPPVQPFPSLSALGTGIDCTPMSWHNQRFQHVVFVGKGEKEPPPPPPISPWKHDAFKCTPFRAPGYTPRGYMHRFPTLREPLGT